MIKRSLLTIALVASAGAVHAQGEPADPYGRPLLGRGDWVRQPGDQPGPSNGSGMNPRMTTTTTVTSGGMAAVPPPMAAPMPAPAPMPAATFQTNTVANTVVGEPRDPYGRPLIGRNDWVRQPGDQRGPAGAGVSASAGVAAPYAAPNMAAAPSASADAQLGSGPHPVAFRDEFGFRYDAQGNRLDARGYVISPQTR
ncbi:MAG: hypothetical protein EPO67_06750 [Reyranella sp.]|nr:MAG: hypothetical protein EPO67_06750 [Reyranella sp.]